MLVNVKLSNACQCEIVLIPRSPLKCSSHQEFARMDSDKSNRLSTIHEHECTLIRLVLNLSSFCQVTNNSFPPRSCRVSETVHRSFQFQHLFSRHLQFVTHLLWRLCIHISSCLFTITRQKSCLHITLSQAKATRRRELNYELSRKATQ